MIEACAATGYAGASVARVIAATGTSRSTFYEHFRDKDECFLAALRLLSDRVMGRLGSSAPLGRPAAGTAVDPVLEFLAEDRAGARVLFHESLAADDRALRIRGQLARKIAPTMSGADDEMAAITVGGLFRLFAIWLHREVPVGAASSQELHQWLDSYPTELRPGSARRTANHKPISMLPLLNSASTPGVGASRRGVRSDSPQHRRSRITAAVTGCAYERTYSQVTVADVTATAGVSRKAFYELFSDRTQAAAEANERFFQGAMTAVAGEFFAASGWPDRIWSAGAALLGFLAIHPAEAYLGFVETHRIGEGVVTMTYDRLSAFTLFLQEGYGSTASGPPQVCSEALAATMFELAFAELSEHRSAEHLLERLPAFVYVVLAPFIGAEEAERFVAAKIAQA